MKFFSLVLRNLGRKWLRTVLTMLSIGVAFVLYALLGATRQGLTGGIEIADQDRIVVRHRVSLTLNLPVAYVSRIQRIPGVSLVVPFSWFHALYQDEKQPMGCFPTQPEPLLELYPEIVLPADQKQAWLATRTGMIVGRKAADRFGWKIGQRIPLRSPIWPKKSDDGAWEFEIVGIFDATEKGFDTSGLYFRQDYFDETRRWGEGNFGWSILRVSDPTRTEAIAKQIEEEFANSATEVRAEPEGAFIQGFAQQIGDVATIIVGIVSAVFFTILLVAGNTVSQSVRERVAEIGVLKALGFPDRTVLFIVLAESLAIAVIAGLGGLALGSLVVLGLAQALSSMLPTFYLPASYIGVGVALAFALGLAAGLVPALQAGRLRIADALRRGA